LFAGFHRCPPALADTGDDLIVDHVIEFPAWRDELDPRERSRNAGQPCAPRHDAGMSKFAMP
jgi:hypothetical protein